MTSVANYDRVVASIKKTKVGKERTMYNVVIRNLHFITKHVALRHHQGPNFICREKIERHTHTTEYSVF